MSDRVLQDDLIRALADAPFRSSDPWRSRALAEPDRVERFAHFLARHYYYERVVHFFKYSRALARVTGRWPEAVLRSGEFDLLLPGVVLGSRPTAEAVASLVADDLRRAPGLDAVPYHHDLLAYQEAMMVAEAGPRRWRGDTDEAGPAPQVAEGTRIVGLAFDVTSVLPALLRPWNEVPLAERRSTRLIVARSPRGRVVVARSSDVAERVLGLADGRRPIAELAALADLGEEALRETVEGLAEIGALRFPRGS